MGLLAKMQKRVAGGPSDADDRWYMPFGGVSEAGVEVTDEVALTLSAYWCGVNIITAAMGSIPLKLYKRTGARSKEVARKHPAHRVCALRPNNWLTPFEYRQMIQGHLLMRGNGYSQIVRDRMGRLMQLIPLHPDRMEPKVEDGRIIYKFQQLDGTERIFQAEEILHHRGLSSNGLVGYNPIQIARQTLGMALAAQKHGSRWFKNFGRPGGYLSTEQNITDAEVRKLMKANWMNAQGGENVHSPAILEGGLEWHTIGFSQEDSQWLGTMTHGITDVARLLNMPPHKLKEMSRATFSNIEHQSLEFIIDTITPWAVGQEERCNASLLTEQELEDHYFKFSLEALLRGDSSARATFYSQMFNMGVYSPNDIRDMEDEDEIPGGDQRFVPLAMVPLERASDVFGNGSGLMDETGTEEGTEDDEARGLEQRRLIQRRSLQTRRKFRLAYETVFRNAGDRIVKREVKALKAIISSALGDRDSSVDLKDKLREFYQGHRAYVRDVVLPLLVAYMDLIGDAAAQEVGEELDSFEAKSRFTRDYAEAMSVRHVRSSERQLNQLIDVTDPELLEPALVARLDEWSLTRPGKIGMREAVQGNGAFSRAVYKAFGFGAVWVTFGDTCPLCLSLEGMSVGLGDDFCKKGDVIDPEDGETGPLIVSNNVAHPQLHNGCDCSISASA